MTFYSASARNVLVLFWLLPLLSGVGLIGRTLAQARLPIGKDGLPGGVKTVGARRQPKGTRVFRVNSNGEVGDGVKNSTNAIQKAIDSCAKAGGGVVTFDPGSYLTGALFLKGNVHLRLDAGVTLLGS